jgi:anti-sigma regulatory factor (Ser/Thr protein kinase)
MTFSPMSGRAGTVGGMAGGSGVTPAALQEHGSGTGPASHFKEVPSVSSPSQWPLRSHLELGALPTAVPCFRLHARLIMQEWGQDELADSIELIVSELVTNGLRASEGISGSRFYGRWSAGTPPIRLWLCSDRRQVLIQVWDGNDRKPEVKEPDAEGPGGRGLILVETLSAEWGTYRPQGSSGKVVWALIVR